MPDEWDFGGGKYKSVVHLENIRAAQGHAEDLGNRMRIVSQRLAAEHIGLSSPSGDHAVLAYRHQILASGRDMQSLGNDAHRLYERLLWLSEQLDSAEDTYRDAEARLQIEIDKRNPGIDWGKVTLAIGVSLIPGANWIKVGVWIVGNLTFDIAERVMAGDHELEGVGPVDLLLAAVLEEGDEIMGEVGSRIEQLLIPLVGLPTGDGTVGAARGIRYITSRWTGFSSGSGFLSFRGAGGYDVIVEELPEQVPHLSAVHDLPPASSETLVDLFDGVAQLSDSASALPGVVEIREQSLPDGSRSWTVIIPGTQEQTVGFGANPNDNASNLDLMAEGTADTTMGVYLAMQQAGIKPNEPVTLVGHSQGGMTAASLAGLEGVDKEFRISSIVTAGSPIGAGFNIPENVNVLSVEHQNDFVTKLDGSKNDHTENHVTIVRHLREAEDDATRALAYDPGAAHSTAAYKDTFEELMNEGLEPVEAWLSDSAATVGQYVTVEKTTRYGIRRTEEDLTTTAAEALQDPD